MDETYTVGSANYAKDDDTVGYVDDYGDVTYKQIRDAMGGKNYPFEAVGHDGKAVVYAVNRGIDTHLEACFDASKDSYEPFARRLPPSSRFPEGAVLATGIRGSVSPDSMPTLLRRLMELPGLVEEGKAKVSQEVAEAGESFAMAIVDGLLTPEDE